MTWNKDKFLKKNKESRGEVSPGTYICELESTGVARAKSSDKLQLSEYWKVDSDDLNHPGTTISNYTRLYDDDGEPSGFFTDRLRNLQLEVDINVIPDNEEGAIEYLDKLVKTKIGCKARIKVAVNTKNPDFPYKNIQQIIDPGNGEASVDKFKPGDLTTNYATTLKEGNVVNVKVADGERAAVVNTVVNNGQDVLVKMLSDGVTTVIPAKDCSVLYQTEAEWEAVKSRQQLQSEKVEEVKDIEEIQEIELKVGLPAKGVYKGQQITGKIHALDEVNQIVKIAYNGQAYPCPLATIELVS